MDYRDLPNLASTQLGSQIVFATDEWFASADNMIKDEEPVWKEGLYTTYGKWMDGWESRRRRTAGHDWCIVQLGIPGIIKAIEVDTAFFTGNFSPKVSVTGTNIVHSVEISTLLKLREETKSSRPEDGTMGTCASEKEWTLVNQLNSSNWNELVTLTPLGAGYEDTRRTVFVVQSNETTTHLRVNMGPDGGIARVRVYGYVSVNPENISRGEETDLVSVENGGLAIAWSNMHYGHPRNLIVPGRGTCMGDGWETARQPNRPAVYVEGPDGLIVLPGFDWAILKLGIVGVISFIEVDTNFYKGNYPESCLIEGCYSQDRPIDAFKTPYQDSSLPWKVLLKRTKLSSSAQHYFGPEKPEFQHIGPISHIRLTIYPDGGIMRLRLYGKHTASSKL